MISANEKKKNTKANENVLPLHFVNRKKDEIVTEEVTRHLVRPLNDFFFL
jgi:hypothetical protein